MFLDGQVREECEKLNYNYIRVHICVYICVNCSPRDSLKC